MSIGDGCFVQNQTGISPKRWDRTGIVIDMGANDQYIVKINGSGRLTSRNRRFLRQFQLPAWSNFFPSSEEETPIGQKRTSGNLRSTCCRQTLCQMHQIREARANWNPLSHPLRTPNTRALPEKVQKQEFLQP
ncbi:hypothetical protein RRG08_015956 [Elysia crispata]|uniref:Uncharacterized protein n=1 Tax=Elysia crispata TaxID=231223 RepID=A0AAE1E1G3_9GAST|nr:hypothetical protein RRG08_015956 [Elysia crispata]